ncbi:type II toxin-antitoxin system RnlB family antitoxin [Pseudanabaena sp. FACHB-1998]|uniref:type II toxin-antitoxin system RnlB family antitoxin n=1 Tax=Pseudanabaena sp. FACHB-1998 TaxID=2692858 RepID=UPI0016817EEF|nr:type II toxin-antitoxin system RnlB family antitoxin [Pseudanabaena sp. FACHB-1998]MBD2177979.1 type II toxin-antitoxin system RnlB family antitoxin [Pseudanabaena sp. FACHB-1998]
MIDAKQLYEIERFSNHTIIVFSMTYMNPISYLPTIEKDLGKLDFSGKIIFDLLLSNGNSSNRFVEARVNKAKIDRRSMKVIGYSSLEASFIKKTREFYKSHKSILDNSTILLDEEKFNLIYN